MAKGTRAVDPKSTRERVDPRPSRSKRGISAADTSQICFRVNKDKHKALKVYCVENDLEIGEAMERALDALLSSAGRRR